jgi:hypothetical protein
MHRNILLIHESTVFKAKYTHYRLAAVKHKIDSLYVNGSVNLNFLDVLYGYSNYAIPAVIYTLRILRHQLQYHHRRSKHLQTGTAVQHAELYDKSTVSQEMLHNCQLLWKQTGARINNSHTASDHHRRRHYVWSIRVAMIRTDSAIRQEFLK